MRPPDRPVSRRSPSPESVAYGSARRPPTLRESAPFYGTDSWAASTRGVGDESEVMDGR